MAKKEKPKKEEAPPVDGAEGEEGEAPKKKGLPIMLIAIAGGAVVLLGGGGAAAYFLFLKPKPAAEAGAHGEEAKGGHGEEKKKDDGHGKKKEEKGGHGGGGEKVDPKTQPVIAEGPDGITYFTLPDTLANIQTTDGKSTYLKLKLTFEVADQETVDLLNESLPRIDDVLQGFLRELRPEDVTGSQGSYQLRLEILRRVNLVLAPHKINAVLIEEMLIT
ncbi:flagellar basal body-associated FliL family protein [Asticcacaulis sp. DW145]|jgi:flagellar FliL protein|uniref:Flagellar protein FliL n=1 Tax=Asticcacaulis currens TaxID=2984210 RepID=A0ABT5IH53_9CAUL|nr:flagellar basal body-associated FliL family protein [Asticcacaulis currens]MDC7695510.1 flagellar basal body-associated FliL family protein [Asticcacaulis currens]BEV10816.1 flagellar basal body-associated FliL family protein [Asticcacaulis sp. DW145]